MNPNARLHPQRNELEAFASGQAPDESAAAISEHLAECEPCRTVVDSLPPDTLLSLLKKAPEPNCAETSPALDKIGAASQAATLEVTLAPSAAAPAGSVPPELAGHAKYQVLGLLGSGGMGAVYKAEHRRMERHVALKVMSTSLMTKPAMVERFHREVKAAARLTHPNIVTAYDADQAGDTHFLVMEHVEGLSLAEHAQQQGPLPVAEACAYVRQAALGLQHAFERDMVHRDIKPHNLMLTPGGEVKILDFGLARFVREAAAVDESSPSATVPSEAAAVGLTEVGMLMGTADFIAPEQANDPRQADIRADIYSLGCTLYFLLAGQPPFGESTLRDKLTAHAKKSPPALTKLRCDVPAELARVVDKMMAKDPAQRYRTPAEAADALVPFIRKPSWIRRLKRPLAAAGVLAAALVAAAVIYVKTDQGEFTIETNDDDVAVAINKTGIRIYDRASGRNYDLKVGKHNIRTGQYEIDVSELGAGIALSTPEFRLHRGGTERLLVTFKQKGDRAFVLEGLKWFPADTTFFEIWDHRVFPKLSAPQWVLLTDFPFSSDTQENERFYRFMTLLGEVNRSSVAFAVDATSPGKSRVFLRLTGSIQHQRLADWLRQEWPTAIVREEKGADGAPITIFFATKETPLGLPTLALVGSTDVISASYTRFSLKGFAVLEQMLALRAGKGESLASTALATNAEVPDNAWVFVAGQPPKEMHRFFLLPGLPRSVLLTVTGQKIVQFHMHGQFGTPAEAESAAKLYGGLRQLAALLIKLPPFSNYPKVSEHMGKTLSELKIAVNGERVNGDWQMSGAGVDAIIEMLTELPLSKLKRGFDKYQKGLALRKQGKLPEAEAAFRDAVAADPGDPLYLHMYGLALHEQKKYEEAIVVYRKELSIDADRFEANRGLARIYFALTKYAEAIPYYQKAMKLQPTEAFARSGATRCFALAGAGQGDAARLDDKERAQFRRQAVDLLRADLTALAERAKSGKQPDRQEVRKQLQEWRTDKLLSGIRDAGALAKLPAAERENYEKLWADVAALLEKIGQSK